MRTVLAAMAAVAVAFAAVLWFGFWIDERTGAIPDALFGLIAAIAIAAIAGAILWFLGRLSPGEEADCIWGKEGARPRNPAHGLMVNRKDRTAAQIAYDGDLNLTGSCIHLEPIERAMRRAGIDMHMFDPPGQGPIVRAECHINDAELRRVFALPESVVYREEYRPEVSDREEPRANLYCRECPDPDNPRCNILVVHPIDSYARRPWFPAPPPGQPDAK